MKKDSKGREMRERGYGLVLIYYGTERFVAHYHKISKCRNYPEDIYAETDPLARALAAYKALTGKEWRGEGDEYS